MRHLKGFIVALGFGLATACSGGTPSDVPPLANCDGSGIGVSRTLTVNLDSSPVEGLLQPGEVVLTFDDGPVKGRTRGVLEALANHCTQATFFLQGNHAEAAPWLVRQIVRGGHSLGGHSWDHAYLTGLSIEDARADVLRGIAAIDAAQARLDTPDPIKLFRFTYLAQNEDLNAMIRALGLVDVGVTVDAADWTGNSPQERVDLLLTGLEAAGRKGVVLLHDPFEKSVETTALLLDRLKADGFEIVALKFGEPS